MSKLKKAGLFLLSWIFMVVASTFVSAVLINLAVFFNILQLTDNADTAPSILTMAVFSWLAVSMLSLGLYFAPLKLRIAGLVVAAFLPGIFAVVFGMGFSSI